jgi:septal ring factor EnvC (AmiA/AmiB activator)
VQAARRKQFDEVQATWSEAQAEVERLRQQLIEARAAMEEQTRAERERMAADHRRALAELEEQRLSLARRSEHVDQCRTALEQLRGELGQMHRETLEIRLATEELWVQLSGTAPAATLTCSLGQVRAKLAEQYRMANAELAEQRKELDGIRAQLVAQHEKLLVQKRDLDAWAGRRQEEIQQQAARLVAREQELERQDAESKQQSQQWQIEELNYRREIFSLRAQLQQSQPDEPVATAS